MIRIGQRLHEERIRKGLTLEDISKATKIKVSFLSAIEKGEYQKLPSSTYARGFVLNYAEFLGFPKRETLALFRREFDEDKIFKVLPDGFSKKDDFSVSKIKSFHTFIAVFAIIFVFASYILFSYRYAIINPPLEIYSPKEKEIISSLEVTVAGKTDPNSSVYVNKDLVFLDDKGNFKKTIDLFPGKTAVKIKAVNKFGKTTEVQRNVEVVP